MATLELLAGERQASETTKQVEACNDWLRLGPKRTMPALVEFWGTEPLASLSTVKRWSAALGWAKREEAYDGQISAARTARSKRIMQTGTALPHSRVQKLKKLERFLHDQIFHENKNRPDGLQNDLVWVRDVKIGGFGPAATVEEVFRFNSALVEQYRGALEDLAKETGGRVNKTELTGKDGGPLSFMELMQQAAAQDDEE